MACRALSTTLGSPNIFSSMPRTASALLDAKNSGKEANAARNCRALACSCGFSGAAAASASIAVHSSARVYSAPMAATSAGCTAVAVISTTGAASRAGAEAGAGRPAGPLQQGGARRGNTSRTVSRFQFSTENPDLLPLLQKTAAACGSAAAARRWLNRTGKTDAAEWFCDTSRAMAKLD